ncbi:hypothetical protein H012_gp449 [Acanthamoeba polyphaga moumouvirus]|uniref:Uncharacterized protein n=2 Tax=Moumouvirus TaxID=3080801 RepID=L7RG58_9VIRU|nr:hypothetical protein H012_gp449 [Acanthamoeba polyphaga moumouvirus]AEX62713.1 hypothetical protein mv_R508 [Moumouvirus Monve]AGC02010.1 hypothetical protein Moumou_00476 [Acanthamoeba polyphaga moumouvirus]AQN68378.1 hypothetical protein [Saudi moumouvirus]
MSSNQKKYKINSKIISDRYYEFIFDIFDYLKQLENELEWLSDKICFNVSQNVDIGILCKSQFTGNILLLFLEIIRTKNLNLFINILEQKEHFDLTISQIMENLSGYINNKTICHDFIDFKQNNTIYRGLTLVELEDIINKMINAESTYNIIFDGNLVV